MSRPRILLSILASVAAALSAPHGRSYAQATPVPTAAEHATPVPPATPNQGNKETSLQRIQRYVISIDHEASTPEGEQAVIARLSQQLHASPDSLQSQHARWGLGYGEIAMVHGFARDSKISGVTPDDIVALRRSGKSWEDIGKQLGVKVDNIAARMKKTVNPHAKPSPPPKKEQK